MTPPEAVGSLDLATLRSAYADGALTPSDVAAAVLQRLDDCPDEAVWITRVAAADLLRAAAALDPGDRERLPLWGVPFAVKDNIDVAGLPTTAACPAFAYAPAETATAVQLLLDAGAILVGKTNLDQFATGLNGTRSPYGAPRSPLDPDYISGGSSSGSAVAVARGLVTFALGTDTAGSGRVPAALTGTVGVKPSLGLVSTSGVLPACASLDCTTVFALGTADAAAVLSVIAGPDPADPWSRELPLPPARPVAAALEGVRLAVPSHVDDWGDLGEERLWHTACDRLVTAGVELVETDLASFHAMGAELYGGAWVAERLDGLTTFLDEHPGDVHPVVRDVLEPGREVRGTEVFEALTRLQDERRAARTRLAAVDALLTPTVTATFRVAELLERPVELNSRLGRYTTFTNLLDLCAVAVPAGTGVRGMPFGVTLQAPAGADGRLAALAAALEQLLGTGRAVEGRAGDRVAATASTARTPPAPRP